MGWGWRGKKVKSGLGRGPTYYTHEERRRRQILFLPLPFRNTFLEGRTAVHR